MTQSATPRAHVRRNPEPQPKLIGFLNRPGMPPCPVWHVPAPGDDPGAVESFRVDLALMCIQSGGRLANNSDRCEVQE